MCEKLLVLIKSCWSWSKVAGPDQKLLVPIKSCWSWSKDAGLDQKLLVLIKSSWSWSKVVIKNWWSWSKVDQNSLVLIKSCWFWSKVTGPDQKLLVLIKSCWSWSKVAGPVTAWLIGDMLAWISNYNMVRWISAPGTMHFCPQYDTFWPCGLFTLLQFCKHPPSKISMKLRWVSSVNLVNCGDIFNLLTILSSPEINDSF